MRVSFGRSKLGSKTKRWTKNKKTNFAPGPGTVIIGFSAKKHAEPIKNQLLRPVLKPIRGTFYFWFTKLSVSLRFARMAICDKVEPLKVRMLGSVLKSESVPKQALESVSRVHKHRLRVAF